MKLRNVSWLVGGSLVMGVVVLACSGSSTTSGTNGDGGTSSSSSSSGSSGDTQAAAEACGIVLGATYKTHYEVSGTGTNCTAPPDSTSVAAPPDGGADASTPVDAGIACTTSQSGCTFTTHCTTDQEGIASVIDTTETISSTGTTGTSHEKVTKDSDGTVVVDCTLNVTSTKQ